MEKENKGMVVNKALNQPREKDPNKHHYISIYSDITENFLYYDKSKLYVAFLSSNWKKKKKKLKKRTSSETVL